MSRDRGTNLMFDENELKSLPPGLLPRLIRIIYFGLQITNEDYLKRYHEHIQEREPDKSHKKFMEESSSNRKFIRERSNLTFNMLSKAIDAMGYDLETVSVVMRDRLTKERVSFSTDDTLYTLQERIAKEKKIGTGGID